MNCALEMDEEKRLSPLVIATQRGISKQCGSWGGEGDGHFGACLHHVTNSRVRSRLCVVPCIYYC